LRRGFCLFFILQLIYSCMVFSLTHRTYNWRGVNIEVWQGMVGVDRIEPIVGDGFVSEVPVDSMGEFEYLSDKYDLILNGTFFDKKWRIMGIIFKDKKPLVWPDVEKVFGRTAFGIVDGSFEVAPFDGWMILKFKFSTAEVLEFSVDGYNCLSDGLAIYDKRWGMWHGESGLLVKKGKVAAVIRNSYYPEDGEYIISFPKELEDLILAKKPIRVDLEWELATPWNRAEWFVVAGPMLLPVITWYKEGFNKKFYSRRTTRVFIGTRSGKDFVLGVVKYPGLSLKDLREFLIKIGLKKAVNLDGGSSTTFWWRGKVWPIASKSLTNFVGVKSGEEIVSMKD